jgi:hypothetical protein
MNLRYSLLLPLVVAAAACGRQDAAPFVAPDAVANATGTATIRMIVMRDTAVSRTTPKWAPAGATAANNQTRVNLYVAGDTLNLIRSGLTSATGEIIFGGLLPGNYVLKPVIRSKSTTTAPVTGIPVSVASGSKVTVDTIRVRLSTRIIGLMATEFLNQVTLQRIRHGGVKIRVYRETGSATNVYNLVDSVTTNAVGNYEVFVAPGPERVQLKFNSTDITNFKDSTTFQGLPPIPYVKKEETVTITNATPGRDITQDLKFNYPTRIIGFLYRDKNSSGFRDSTSAAKEGLIAGDTIQVQLRDSTGSRVVATTRIIATTTTPVAGPGPTFTFNSVAPGKYVIRMDPLASHFGSNPLEFFQGPTYVVVVPPLPASSTTIVSVQQDFGLKTGQ